MRIDKTGKGPNVPNAFTQSDPTRQFGGVRREEFIINDAPVEAFGDASGQLAIANALKEAGNQVLDIAVRERRMQEAEDDAARKRMQTEYGLKEKEIRLNLETEALDNNWVPDKKHEEYTKRMELAQQEIKGTYQYKTIADEAINKDFNMLTKNYDIEYRAGTIEKDRLNNIRYSQQKTINAYIQNGAYAGKSRDVNTLTASINEIRRITGSQQYQLTNGGKQSAADEVNAIKDVVIGFVKETAQQNPEDAKSMLEEGGVLYDILDKTNSLMIREDLQNVIESKEREKTLEQNKKEEKVYGHYTLMIETGQPVLETDILATNLSDSKKATLISKLKTERKNNDNKYSDFNDVNNVINSGGTYYGMGKSERKKVDNWYEQLLVTTKDLNPTQAASIIMERVSQVGVVPEKLKMKINGMLASTDENVAKQGLGIITALKRQNYRLEKEFDDETNALVELASDKFSLTESKQIIRRSKQMTEIEKADWKQTSLNYFGGKESEAKNNALNKIHELATDRFNWELGSENNFAIPDEAASDYRDMFRNNLLLVQDTTVAKKLTDEKFLRKWGRSNADGADRVMKYAPESVYGTGNPEYDTYISKQLEYEVNEIYGIPKGQYRLEVNPASIERGQQPSYFIFDLRYGNLEVLRHPSDGSPLTWKPDLKAWKQQEVNVMSNQKAQEIGDAQDKEEMNLSSQQTKKDFGQSVHDKTKPDSNFPSLGPSLKTERMIQKYKDGK